MREENRFYVFCLFFFYIALTKKKKKKSNFDLKSVNRPALLDVAKPLQKCSRPVRRKDAHRVFHRQEIKSRGGRFLEAPVAGSQQISNDGMLVILAAGDRTVYEDCSSCFQAMGKTSFFLGM